jgi:helicase
MFYQLGTKKDAVAMQNSPSQSMTKPIFMDDVSLLMASGFNLVVQMPTGTGKTYRAEKAIIDTCRVGFSAIYIAPTRALANELYTRWSDEYKTLKVGIFTGDYGTDRDYPVPFVDAKILIMTPERLDICTRQWPSHWRWMPKVDLVVVDEIHLLGETSRGARLEGSIVRFRHINPFARVIGLSATLGNAQEIAEWLEGAVYHSKAQGIPTEWKYAEFSKADQKPLKLIEVIQPIVAIGARSLVFVQSKRRAEHLAAFLRSVGMNAEHHHGGLGFKERAEVESRFRNRQSEVLIATGTLEVGLNLPVRQVVLYDVQQFDGSDFKPLSVISAWQRAGRAGRLGFDEKGEVVVFRARWEKAQHYERGEFESIDSQMVKRTQLAEQIIVSIASNYARNRAELTQLFARTLASVQKRLNGLDLITDTMCEAGFLKEEILGDETTPRLKATQLGRLCTRLLISPDTVLQIKRTLQLQRAWTNLDLLLLACALPDSEQQIIVDYEELTHLGMGLAQRRSYLLKGDGQHIVEILSITNKHLLSAIKGALILLAWTEMESADEVAEIMSCYSNDVTRIKESTLRMLTAIKAVIKISKGDEEMLGIDHAHLDKKITLLELMVRTGLNKEASTLTLVPGIGKAWAKKLVAIGITDLELLAQSSSETLIALGNLSKKRSEEWIENASQLLSSDDLRVISDTADFIQVDTTGINLPVDVYRLKRSWQLQVVATAEPDTFQVSGGADPHLVRETPRSLSCDCLDRASGHECKHLIAFRRWQGDPIILDVDKALLQQTQLYEVNLRTWWSR